MKKNYQIVSKALLIALLFILPGALLSQNANRAEGSDELVYQWYLNLNGGITQAYGDILAGSWHGDMLQGESVAFAGGLRLGKHISPVFGIYGSGVLGNIKGISGEDTKDLEFQTSFTEGILGGTMSLSNLIAGYKPRLLNFYLTGGVGLINFSPEVYDKGTDNRVIQPGVAEDYEGTTEALIPVGGGLDIRLNDRWDINLESTLRLVDGDKLDGYVSGENTDGFFYTSVGVGYSFGKKSGPKMQLITDSTMLVLVGDSIPIQIKGEFPESFNKRAVVEFTPELKYGTETKMLETMYFQGAEVSEENQKEGAMVISEDGGTFTYTTYVMYEPGMDISELYVEPMVSVKGRQPSTMGDRKIADGLIMTSKRISNTEKVLLADHGYQRDIVVNQMATIYYVVNRHNVNMNFRLNKREEAIQARDDLKAFVNKGWEIQKITVHAWASPEGEESFNQGLSKRRSETGQKWIADVYDKHIKNWAKEMGVKADEIKQDINYNVEAHGEDWDGFMKALQASDIEDKNIIANVVNSQPDLKKREQEIRNMTVIYKEIEDEILPPLRRSEITVYSFEPSLTDDEIAQLAVTNPDSLTINELLYAGSELTDENTAKLNIYKTVIDQYPDDWRGYNNAGKVSVEMGDYNAAQNYFAKAKTIASNEGVVLNNLGAMASKEKDFKEAKTYYLAAQKQNVDVGYNMGIVKIASGNYNGAINSLGGAKCDYNLALAHMLSGNYNAATSTLNCAEKTAEVYYLQAIIGARTNNDNMVFENLKNAIDKDKGYAKIAREDKEFMKYYTNPKFIEILE